MPRKKKFSAVVAYEKLLDTMEIAINNMIEEGKKEIDDELTGSQRKAELQSVKMTMVDCDELISSYHKIEQKVKQLKDSGEIAESKDYTGGMAEKYAK